MGAFEDYSAALAEFRRIGAEIDAIASSITEVGTKLVRNRAYFTFSNAEGSFPIEAVGMPVSETFDANKWKSAVQINDALSRWHAAGDNVRSIWQGLPRDQQQALQPPPESVLPRRR